MEISLKDTRIFYAILLSYAALLGVSVFFEWYLVSLLPLVLWIVVIALFRMHWIFYGIVMATPLSINLENLEFGLGLALPTEPLLFGLFLVFLLKYLHDGKYDIQIARHPITISIFIYLSWYLITAITSELPLVSFKHFLSKLWFIVPCYFFAALVFKQHKNIDRFIWMFSIPMVLVIAWASYSLAIRGFDEKPAHWVMQPFFKDHTSYGAILAMFVPVLLSYGFMSKLKAQSKFLIWLVIIVFLVGTVLSYTRAAWVSLVAAFGVYLVIKFRVRLSWLFSAAVVLLFLFFSFQEQIFQRLEKNKQDSSGDLTEHVQSISNVASDASNLERINRWTCALKMFSERPFFGYGPGTYAFLYAPYQKSYNLTIISTNFGDLGNAHSEYLGALAEAGVFGALFFLVICFFVFYRGILLYYKLDDPRYKAIVMGVLLGLVTYYTHGVLNNYLDLDKGAVPFWAFIAIITALDVENNKRKGVA